MNRRYLLIFLILFCSTLTLLPDIQLKEFKRLPVIYRGRILPLDTFARNTLKQLSGKSSYQSLSASRWLGDTLFKPEKSENYRVFLISNPDIPGALGIKSSGKGRDRYSFSQLIPAINSLDILVSRITSKNQNRLSLLEKDLLILQKKMVIYRELITTFLFAFPHPQGSFTNMTDRAYDSYLQKSSYLELIVQFKKVSESLNPGSKRDTENNRFVAAIQNIPKSFINSGFPIIPVKSGNWLSPWEYLVKELNRTADLSSLTRSLEKIAKSYRENLQKDFDDNLKKFIQISGSENLLDFKKLDREITYNSVDPFYKSKFLYGFSAILLLLSSLFERKKTFIVSGFLLGIIGSILHLWGIWIRFLITNRPPVTNLYETFIFTGIITSLLGILLYLKLKNSSILTGGNIIALLMLFIAGKYSMEGDTMGVLVAVLDSNFWLAAHVITIILGYAGIILSGFMGHVWLIRNLFGKVEESTFKGIYTTQAFGLLFTFTGTVLGGVWADQSWGRFWGWDPKENGALAVLIFSAIIFHAFKGGMIGKRGFAAGAVGGAVIVALAWFGVNLLGVGLHSYGFTSGVAVPLLIYVVLELLFLGFTCKINSKSRENL